MVIDERNDQWVPVRASGFTQAECNGRNAYVIGDKEYSECSFCPASCPSRDWFKEPDSGLPLKCDMCEDVPPLKEPMCVQMCGRDCLTYSEREVEVVEEEVTRGEMEMGIESLIKKYGAESVRKAVSRATKR